MNYKMLLLSISFIFFFACSDDGSEEQRFMNTYKQILVVRESVQDSADANRKVGMIISKNGYTDVSFRETFFELAKDKQRFTKMMDSIRRLILQDTTSFK